MPRVSALPLSAHDAADNRLVLAYTAALYNRNDDNFVTARLHAANLSKRAAWLGACAWDGIAPMSPFVIFTEDNPYAERYDALAMIPAPVPDPLFKVTVHHDGRTIYSTEWITRDEALVEHDQALRAIDEGDDETIVRWHKKGVTLSSS